MKTLECLLAVEFSRNTRSWQCWQFQSLPKFENKLDTVISHINYNLMQHDKFKYV